MHTSVGAKLGDFFGYPVRPGLGCALFCHILGVGIRSWTTNLVTCAGLVRVCVTHFWRFRVPGAFGFVLPAIFSGVRLHYERIPIAQGGCSMTLSGD